MGRVIPLIMATLSDNVTMYFAVFAIDLLYMYHHFSTYLIRTTARSGQGSLLCPWRSAQSTGTSGLPMESKSSLLTVR